MQITTNYKFGDIVLVAFPFTNHNDEKKRPAVVVSSSIYHQERPDIILMPITSKIRPNSFGELIIQDWQDANLIKPSVIKPIVITFEKDLIIKEWGCLSNNDQAALYHILFDLIGQKKS